MRWLPNQSHFLVIVDRFTNQKMGLRLSLVLPPMSPWPWPKSIWKICLCFAVVDRYVCRVQRLEKHSREDCHSLSWIMSCLDFCLWWSIQHYISFIVYTSESKGSDETGDGSKEKPFQTIKRGIRESLDHPNSKVYCDAKKVEGDQPQVGLLFFEWHDFIADIYILNFIFLPPISAYGQ